MTDALVPAGYDAVLTRLKDEVRTARMSAQRAANAELLRLYRTIGQTILEQQAVAGWGGKIIDRLSADLRREFPGMSGLARSNLYYMRAFAAAWPNGEVVPRSVGQLPWRMVKLSDRGERDWYADMAVGDALSLSVFEHQIAPVLNYGCGGRGSWLESLVGWAPSSRPRAARHRQCPHVGLDRRARPCPDANGSCRVMTQLSPLGPFDFIRGLS